MMTARKEDLSRHGEVQHIFIYKYSNIPMQSSGKTKSRPNMALYVQ
jgi:hypothetical protein